MTTEIAPETIPVVPTGPGALDAAPVENLVTTATTPDSEQPAALVLDAVGPLVPLPLAGQLFAKTEQLKQADPADALSILRLSGEVIAIVQQLADEATAAAAAPAPADPQRADDMAYLQSVIAQSGDMWDDEVGLRLEAVIAKYPGDVEVENAWRDAVTSYSNFMSTAIGTQL